MTWIPDEFLERIEAGHRQGRALLARHGFQSEEIEPADVAFMVEAHRWAWKPDTVKLVLLAESHVFTTPNELAISYLGHPALSNLGPLPTQYVRLIYCLGYGEKMICPGLSGGTPQFWAIFGALAGTKPKHTPGAPWQYRFQEKVETLRRLKKLGVWLLDSSLHGISSPKGRRLDDNRSGLTSSLQSIWFESYGQAVLDHVRPERVVAVGKGVHAALAGRIKMDGWIYQPQGARSAEQVSYNRERLMVLRNWLTATSD